MQTGGAQPHSIFQDERSPLMRFVGTVRLADDEYERIVTEPRESYDKARERVDRAAAYLAAIQKADAEREVTMFEALGEYRKAIEDMRDKR
jgi:hypothetical protein